jgi:hypothetical protein
MILAEIAQALQLLDYGDSAAAAEETNAPH